MKIISAFLIFFIICMTVYGKNNSIENISRIPQGKVDIAVWNNTSRIRPEAPVSCKVRLPEGIVIQDTAFKISCGNGGELPVQVLHANDNYTVDFSARLEPGKNRFTLEYAPGEPFRGLDGAYCHVMPSKNALWESIRDVTGNVIAGKASVFALGSDGKKYQMKITSVRSERGRSLHRITCKSGVMFSADSPQDREFSFEARIHSYTLSPVIIVELNATAAHKMVSLRSFGWQCELPEKEKTQSSSVVWFNSGTASASVEQKSSKAEISNSMLKFLILNNVTIAPGTTLSGSSRLAFVSEAGFTDSPKAEISAEK